METITAKVLKTKGYDLAKPENRKASVACIELIPYIGKTITFQIIEVKETVVTEKKDQGVVITETKKVTPDTKPVTK